MIHQQKTVNEQLYDAVANNKTAEALALIKSGVDVNFKNNSSWSLLHRATSFENTAVMQALIDQGADLEAKDQEEWTPLTYAVGINKLVPLQTLLDNKANINVRSLSQYTPLIMAADRGHADIVSELLQRGADVNLTDDSGWTPLFHASFYGRLEIMRLVLDAGVSINAVNGWNETALQMVATNKNGKAKAMALLFEYSTPEQIENALDLAINQDHSEVSDFANSYRAQQRLKVVVNDTVIGAESESIKQPARMRL